jgi:hypothetical protein
MSPSQGPPMPRRLPTTTPRHACWRCTRKGACATNTSWRSRPTLSRCPGLAVPRWRLQCGRVPIWCDILPGQGQILPGSLSGARSGRAICSTSGTPTGTIHSAGSLTKLPAVFPSNPPQFYNVPFSYHQIDPIKESLTERASATSRFQSSGWKRRSQTWNRSREAWSMAIR